MSEQAGTYITKAEAKAYVHFVLENSEFVSKAVDKYAEEAAESWESNYALVIEDEK